MLSQHILNSIFSIRIEAFEPGWSISDEIFIMKTCDFNMFNGIMIFSRDFVFCCLLLLETYLDSISAMSMNCGDKRKISTFNWISNGNRMKYPMKYRKTNSHPEPIVSDSGWISFVEWKILVLIAYKRVEY